MFLSSAISNRSSIEFMVFSSESVGAGDEVSSTCSCMTVDTVGVSEGSEVTELIIEAESIVVLEGAAEVDTEGMAAAITG